MPIGHCLLMVGGPQHLMVGVHQHTCLACGIFASPCPCCAGHVQWVWEERGWNWGGQLNLSPSWVGVVSEMKKGINIQLTWLGEGAPASTMERKMGWGEGCECEAMQELATFAMLNWNYLNWDQNLKESCPWCHDITQWLWFGHFLSSLYPSSSISSLSAYIWTNHLLIPSCPLRLHSLCSTMTHMFLKSYTIWLTTNTAYLGSVTHAVPNHVYKGSVCEPSNSSCTSSLSCESYLLLCISLVWLQQPCLVLSDTLNYYLEPTEHLECTSHISRSHKILTLGAHCYSCMGCTSDLDERDWCLNRMIDVDM
jgi:hypothetical protein